MRPRFTGGILLLQLHAAYLVSEKGDARMPGNGMVFISHAHEDNDRCAPLLAALDAWGVDYWFDTQRMDAGQDLLASVQKAIAERDIFIRVGTNAALNSFWMNQELSAFMGLQAIDHGQGQPDKRLLIPFKLDAEYRFQPVELARIYIDASDKQQRKRWVEELRRALKLNAIGADSHDPGTLIVDCMRQGDYATISEAISAAKPGARIIVRPGLYQEGLMLDKPLQIVGEGALGEVCVEAKGSDIIRSNSPNCRLSNLKLRQAGGGQWYGVYVKRGRLELENCDIASQTGACVAVQGAVAHLRHNVIHNGNVSGVYVFEEGQAILEDNEIRTNGKDGVQVNSRGTVTLRRNTVHDNRRCGVFAHHESNASIEDNDIIGNITGIEVTTGARVQARNNRIIGHAHEAASVYNGGGGSLVDNVVRDNAQGNWYVAADCEASVIREGNIEG